MFITSLKGSFKCFKSRRGAETDEAALWVHEYLPDFGEDIWARLLITASGSMMIALLDVDAHAIREAGVTLESVMDSIKTDIKNGVACFYSTHGEDAVALELELGD